MSTGSVACGCVGAAACACVAGVWAGVAGVCAGGACVAGFDAIPWASVACL